MKKNVTWHALKKALTEGAEPPPVQNRDAFWSDFRARARLTNQEEPAAAWHWTPVWSWATAAACTLLVVGGLSYSWLARPPTLSHIDSVEVIASHGALLIMEDEESQSTMLWVVDMQPGDMT